MLSHNLAGTAADVGFAFSYSAASQMLSQSRDNDSYAWTGAVAVLQIEIPPARATMKKLSW